MANLSRGELNDLLAGFATKNEKYREALLKDPKDVIERQLNSKLPSNLNVKVIQDSASTMHVVLPHVPSEGDELSDSDLESVAGGFLDDSYECNFSEGFAIGTRVEISLV
jgi:hypothetical protein